MIRLSRTPAIALAPVELNPWIVLSVLLLGCLGTGVVSLPYHSPLMVANRIIQLDHMTKGRIMFGAVR